MRAVGRNIRRAVVACIVERRWSCRFVMQLENVALLRWVESFGGCRSTSLTLQLPVDPLARSIGWLPWGRIWVGAA